MKPYSPADYVIHPNYDESQDLLHQHKIHDDIMNDCNEYYGNIKYQVQHPEKFSNW